MTGQSRPWAARTTIPTLPPMTRPSRALDHTPPPLAAYAYHTLLYPAEIRNTEVETAVCELRHESVGTNFHIFSLFAYQADAANRLKILKIGLPRLSWRSSHTAVPTSACSQHQPDRSIGASLPGSLHAHCEEGHHSARGGAERSGGGGASKPIDPPSPQHLAQAVGGGLAPPPALGT